MQPSSMTTIELSNPQTPSTTKSSKSKNWWSAQEDRKLFDVVMDVGQHRWDKVAANFPCRTSKQCRERWLTHVSPDVRKDDWTAEEDAILTALVHELGPKWSKIANKATALAGRPDSAIKNHYVSLVRRGVVPAPSTWLNFANKHSLKNADFDDVDVSPQHNHKPERKTSLLSSPKKSKKEKQSSLRAPSKPTQKKIHTMKHQTVAESELRCDNTFPLIHQQKTNKRYVNDKSCSVFLNDAIPQYSSQRDQGREDLDQVHEQGSSTLSPPSSSRFQQVLFDDREISPTQSVAMASHSFASPKIPIPSHRPTTTGTFSFSSNPRPRTQLAMEALSFASCAPCSSHSNSQVSLDHQQAQYPTLDCCNIDIANMHNSAPAANKQAPPPRAKTLLPSLHSLLTSQRSTNLEMHQHNTYSADQLHNKGCNYPDSHVISSEQQQQQQQQQLSEYTQNILMQLPFYDSLLLCDPNTHTSTSEMHKFGGELFVGANKSSNSSYGVNSNNACGCGFGDGMHEFREAQNDANRCILKQHQQSQHNVHPNNQYNQSVQSTLGVLRNVMAECQRDWM